MILASLFAGLIVLTYNIIQASTRVRDSLIEENTLAARLASRAVETGSLTRLWPLELLKHIDESQDTLFWWVVSPSGKILLSDDVSLQNKEIDNISQGLASEKIEDLNYYKNGEKIKIIIEPIHIKNYPEFYYFYLGISLKRISAVQKNIAEGSIAFFIPIILCAFIISFYLSKSFTKPLDSLMEGVSYVSKGNVNHKIEVTSNDEFGHLASAFNKMSQKLKENKERDELISQMKSDFISIAAHQLRTPLTGIKWVFEALANGDAGELNNEQKEMLKKGYKSNERVIKLANDLLNVASIEDQRAGIKFENCDFEQIFNDALSSFQNLKKNKNIALNINKPEKFPIIYADKEKMELALFNILDNALKYTPHNGIIDINIKLEKKNLIVIVKDNGIGIPIKEQNLLYSKFFRGSNVVRMQAEGTGLGLFIVKNIIDRHRGKIAIKSKEGEGTEVLFSIPITKKERNINLQ